MKSKALRSIGAWTVTGAAVLAVLAGPGIARAETLRSAMEKAIENHPKALRAEWNSEAMLEEANARRGALLPQFSLESSFGEDWRDRSITGVTTSGYETAREGRAVVRQLLFDGFLTTKETKAAFKRSEASEALEADVKEELALGVTEAYLGVLRAREQVGLAVTNVGIHRETLGKTRERAEAGRGQKVDVSLVEARLGLAESTLETLRALLKSNNLRYKQLVGEEPQALQLPSAVPQSALPTSVTESATSGNYARIAAETNYDAAKLDEEASKGLRWPRFDIEVNGSIGQDVGGITGEDNQFGAFLVGRWDLYSGGTLSARQRQRIARANEAAGLVTDAMRIADENLGRAIVESEGARNRENALSDYATSMQAVVEAYEQQFEIGSRAILNVLDVKNEEFRAKSALVDAQFAKSLSDYRMLASMGKLVTTIVGDRGYGPQLAARPRGTEIEPPPGVKVIERIDDGNYDRGGMFGLFKSKRGRVDASGNMVYPGGAAGPADEFGGNKVKYVEWEESETGGNKVEIAAPPAEGSVGTNPVRYEATSEVPEVRRLAE